MIKMMEEDNGLDEEERQRVDQMMEMEMLKAMEEEGGAILSKESLG